MTTPADADAEMREAIAEEFRRYRYGHDGTDDFTNALLAELRRRGAWLPGTEISDAMVHAGEEARVDAAMKALEEGSTTYEHSRLDFMRAALTAALSTSAAANAKARTE